MKKQKKTVACLVFFIMVLGMFMFTGVNATAAQVLTNDDCAKCHDTPPADLAADGGKHKGLTCQGCHEGHPPKVKKPIPLCSNCHQGKSHFELNNCLSCHKNPHTPKKVTFENNITDPCLTCHSQQIKQLRENKSKHTALYCTTCHNAHGKKPDCIKCHKSHSNEMAQADCSKCHKAHMPKVVTYGEVPSKLCASCHQKAFDLLKANSAKHKDLECSFCHKDKHKTLPQCKDCHGEPHPAGMMEKFPKCGACHNIAHDLNKWQKVGPVKKAPAGKTKK